VPSSAAVGFLGAQGLCHGLVPDHREVITKQQQLLLVLWMRRTGRPSTGQAISVAMASQAVLRASLPAHTVWKSGVQETGGVSAAHMVWSACQGALSRPAWPAALSAHARPPIAGCLLHCQRGRAPGHGTALLLTMRGCVLFSSMLVIPWCSCHVVCCRGLRLPAVRATLHTYLRAHTGIHTYTHSTAEMSQQGRYPSAGEHGPSPSRYLAGGRRVLLATR
jgi:hypothetical protein